MSKPLWTFAEALAATDGRLEGGAAPDISSVSIDSRTLIKGALFVAIKGENRDGHVFVEKAFANGAAAAIVETGFKPEGDTGPLIRVADTLRALEFLGRAARQRSKARVIAVTGSAGKTSTKEALRLALMPSGETHASRASYNNHWGVPLSLAEMPRDTAFGVFEVGMNHPGEITPLTKLIRPHVAIVTTVAPVHLGFFDSVEDIARAKAEIFLGLEKDGMAIINHDNDHYDLLRKAAEAVGASIASFGRHRDAQARLVDAKLGSDSTDVVASLNGREIRYRMGAAGEHLAMNSLAVLAAVDAVGGDLGKAAAALKAYRPPKGRGERFTLDLAAGGSIVLIDESYNANPASMRAALMAFAQVPRDQARRRVAALGDMLELGRQGPDLHRALAEPVDAAGVDVVFACGPLMAELFKVLPVGRRGAYAPTSQELEPALLASIAAGDALMIKGSLGSRMGPLVEAVKTKLGSTASREKKSG